MKGSVSKWIAWIFLWSTAFFWGASFVATKLVVGVVPPFFAATVRFFLAWVALRLFSRGRPYGKPLDLVFAGFWGITMYFVFENSALLFTTPTNAVLIISTIPLMNLFYLRLVHRSPVLSQQLWGGLLAFCGVALVVLSGHFVLALNPLGDLLILGAAFSWVFYTHYMMRIEKEGEKQGRRNPLGVTRVMTFWGFLFFLPFAGWEIANGQVHGEVFVHSPLLWVGLLYLGLFCSALGYFFWNRAIQELGPRTTTNAIYAMPVVTALVEGLLLHRFPHVLTLSGGVLILSGLFLSEKKAKRIRS
ncbi:MAG TPA: EamA family transporter [Thermotogota bacterium]|nr:EamA family transporter [Thermotogota bacterium]HRW93181.1 EamA family transporter [Thermotogota bacterium]